MTTPTERTRAVLMVEQEARRFSDIHYFQQSGYVTIPIAEWRDFMRLFRHYPIAMDLRLSHDKIPEVWGEPE